MRLVCLLVLLLGAQEQSKPEWPTYHGDYSLTGYADTKLPGGLIPRIRDGE